MSYRYVRTLSPPSSPHTFTACAGKLTFNWLELHNVRSKSYLQQEFVDKTASLLDEAGVNHGLIFVQDPGSPTQLYRLKDSWIPHNADAYCVVNVYDNMEQFQTVVGTGRLRERESCLL